MYENLKRIIDQSSQIVFFGGAGVSTESGIPDFRSESGLFQAEQKYGRSVEQLISRSFFDAHPDIFYEYYKNNLIFRDANPNEAHKAIATLEQQGKLLAVVTQNIDGLHQKAGSKNVYELHGSVLRNYCMSCGAFYDLDYIMDVANGFASDGKVSCVPRCKKCGGMVKPDVVLYEEPLDEVVLEGAVEAISKADTLIVGGTSLMVYPAAGLLRYFQGGHLVLINRSNTKFDERVDLVIRDPIGTVLGSLNL